MSAELVPFTFEDGHEVRTVTINGEPWFNVGDLCAILEIQNPRDVVAKNLRKDDVAKIYVTIADGRRRQVWFTNEPGVYRLILRSNKPDADRFQDWVCREVLPSIRKTGHFTIDIPMLTIQPTKYRREFPDEFYRHICRLKGKKMPEDLATEPWLAQATANVIYQRLAENLWKAIQKINPIVGRWRKHKIHQHITDGEAKERFRAFIFECIGSMSSFMEWKAFLAHWDGKYPIRRDLPEGAALGFADGQLLLPFAID